MTAVSPSCSAVQGWRFCLQDPASTILPLVAAQSLAQDTEENGAKDHTQSPQRPSWLVSGLAGWGWGITGTCHLT